MITHAIPADIIMRPARDGDQQAIADMLHTCERAYFGSVESPLSATLEWIRDTWQTGGFDLQADSLVAVAPDEQIIGYTTVWRAEHEPHQLVAWPRIHPEYRGRGLGTWMLRWAERRARQIAETLPKTQSVVLSSWVEDVDGAAKELMAREGFLPQRYWWHMEIWMETAPPAPTWPDGVQVRMFIPGQDELVTYEALSEAFQTNGGDPYENFAEWLHSGIEAENFDPSLWFLARGDGDEIAGVILSELQVGEERTLGWISEVGVRPTWRKRGLALALLYHTFGEFYRRGVHTCALVVDAANPSGATRLYERAGMRPNNRTLIRYQKQVRPAALSA
jgi:mycothiol synthase